MNQFITRVYNQLKLDAQKGIITKTSSEKRLCDEISYYRKIQGLTSGEHRADVYFPRFFACQTNNAPYSLELEYFPFKNLGNMVIDQKFDPVLWTGVAKSLKGVLDAFSKINPTDGVASTGDDRKKMFLDKTLKEYEVLKTQNEFFRDFTRHEMLEINNTLYWNFEKVWPKIEPYVTALCSSESFGVIHGDMCFSNILCGFDDKANSVIKFVDPRGSFGSQEGPFGDYRYDLAKLMHSMDGKYEAIIYDKFVIYEKRFQDLRENSLNFEFKDDIDLKYYQIKQVFTKEIFSKYDLNEIMLIEGLIYIGMCARHYDSLDRQQIMYATGIRILNDFWRSVSGEGRLK